MATGAAIIEHVKEAHGLSHAVATDIVNSVFDKIGRELRDGQEVRLGNVGKLVTKVNPPKVVNSFGAKKEIGERRVVKFSAFGGFKEALNTKPVRIASRRRI